VVTCGAVFVYGLDIMQMLALVLVSALLLRRRYGLDRDVVP
jgi:polysaccharide biosynthesis protein PslJ